MNELKEQIELVPFQIIIQILMIATDKQLKTAFEYNKIYLAFLNMLAQPLRNYYRCDLVGYFKFYQNNSMTFLTPNDVGCNYMFQPQNWLLYENWLQQEALYLLQTAYIEGQHYFIWPLKPDNKEQLYFALHDHGIWNGLTIIKKHGDCLEGFVFTSPTMTDEIMDLYLNNKQVFERFIWYFRDKIINKLQIHQPNCGLLPSPINPFIAKSECDNNFYNYLAAIPIKNYYLGRNISLSQREMECLMSLSQGRSIKEIARSCDISSRSVETYINRIKNKTSYATKSQLVTLYHDFF